MQNHIKYIIAYIAGCIVNNKQFTQIKSDQGYHKFSGSINQSSVNINGTDPSYSISGSGDNGKFSSISISETGDKFSLAIDLEQGGFEGYDYAQGSGNFTGSISGSGASLNDSSGTTSEFNLY